MGISSRSSISKVATCKMLNPPELMKCLWHKLKYKHVKKKERKNLFTHR
jgi:hypothetical protein